MSSAATVRPAMSLGGASATGRIAMVRELPVRGMLTVRCNLADPALKAVEDLTGLTLPDRLGIAEAEGHGLGWLSPDELLVMLPYEDVPAAVERLESALSGTHALVADVSDSRSVFSVEGPGARDVVAKLAPVPMERFAPGILRRTRLAQVPAAFWMTEDGAIRLFCFRSQAAYAFDVLSRAASGPRVTV